jgi:hypothetical protein
MKNDSCPVKCRRKTPLLPSFLPGVGRPVAERRAPGAAAPSDHSGDVGAVPAIENEMNGTEPLMRPVAELQAPGAAEPLMRNPASKLPRNFQGYPHPSLTLPLIRGGNKSIRMKCCFPSFPRRGLRGGLRVRRPFLLDKSSFFPPSPARRAGKFLDSRQRRSGMTNVMHLFPGQL